MKICINCKTEKSLTEFTYRKDRSKYKNQCKECIAKKTRTKRNGKELNGYKEVYEEKRYEFDMTKIVTVNLQRVVRCEWCRTLLKSYEIKKGRKHGSDWCKEMNKLEKRKKRLCIRCGTDIEALETIYNNGVFKLHYDKKHCKSCKELIREEKKEATKLRDIERRKKKVIEMKLIRESKIDKIGHTCKSCSTYKTWDKFPKNGGKKYYMCSDCNNFYHRERYHKKQKKQD